MKEKEEIIFVFKKDSEVKVFNLTSMEASNLSALNFTSMLDGFTFIGAYSKSDI